VCAGTGVTAPGVASAGLVFPQHGEHFQVVEGVAPAADDRQQLVVGAEPFQRRVDLAGELAFLACAIFRRWFGW
jgi:hypothetical protein